MRDRVVGPLLDWYDRHARDLPWRVGPGDRRAGVVPDPYRVWLSEIMLQQTTVAAVKAYYQRFTQLWPRVGDLAAADDAQVMAEWAGLGYYARARNLLACARAVAGAGGRFPRERAALEALPGIGPYTSAAIAAIAFDAPETVVDGNVERVVARLWAVEEPMPGVKPQLRALAARLTPDQRPGDFAQAMMDLGATICTPRRPACGLCPIRAACAGQAQGVADQLPARAPRMPKPERTGEVWVVTRPDGAILLERRPARGLLGGTLAFPTGGWDGSPLQPPFGGAWRDLPPVNHIFTHFRLSLTPRLLQVTAEPPRGCFTPRAVFDPAALPGLMRKVWAAVAAEI